MADVGDLIVKFAKNEYTITGLTESDTVLNLKKEIFKLTGVLPEHQKLAGFKVKGQYDEGTLLSKMMLKPKMKLTLIGTRADVIAEFKQPPPDMPEVLDDFDIMDEEVAIESREEYLSKVEKRVKEYPMTLLNPFRENKKLLVLDIDYTLFDHRSTAETPNELMRPYLHEFLSIAYADYDIGIWSATSLKWIEAKLKMLGVSSNPSYKICFHLDSCAMISVHTPKYGVIEVKPLGVIWGKYPQWSEKNTIMFDDIRRNFIMNPHSGLQIRPFREAHKNRVRDRELLKLSEYLQDIASVEDFTTLDHSHWESYRPRPTKKRKENPDTKPSEDKSKSSHTEG